MDDPGARTLRIAAIVPSTTVEGPHARLAVWVAGCTLGCPGCCNPEMFDPEGGEEISVDALLDRRGADVEGVSILGGEPLQQLPRVAALAEAGRARGLGVIVFTGYTLHQARQRPGFAALWSSVDTVVAGRYDARRPEPARGCIGSSNQRLLHRTARYRDPALWIRPRRAEVRIGADGEATVVGAPRLVARVRQRLRSC